MHHLFFYCFLVLFYTYFPSQTKDDSLKFFYYFDNAYKLRNINPDSAFYWINNAFEIAKSTGKKEWQAKTHNLKGILYYKKYDYYQSVLELQTALKLTENNDFKGKIYINLGNTLSDLNYSHSAKYYYEEAIRLFNQTQNYQFLVRALMNLSSEEFNLKQIIPARNHLKLALSYAQDNNLIEEEAMCLNNLSAMFIQEGHIDSASKYIYQSFNIYEQLENYYGLADAYLTAIELHLEKKELEYAKSFIDIADSIIDKLSYLEAKKLLTSEKVNYYLLSKNSEEAMKYFNLYIRLEDSLNKKKTAGKDIDTFSNKNIQTQYAESKNNSNTFSFIQIFVIFITSVFIIFGIFKNYRYYDKE